MKTNLSIAPSNETDRDDGDLDLGPETFFAASVVTPDWDGMAEWRLENPGEEPAIVLQTYRLIGKGPMSCTYEGGLPLSVLPAAFEDLFANSHRAPAAAAIGLVQAKSGQVFIDLELEFSNGHEYVAHFDSIESFLAATKVLLCGMLPSLEQAS